MRTYKVLGNFRKSAKTFCLRVERPVDLIRAGQCFNIGIPGYDINREYSMYSNADENFLDFLIRSVEGGLVSSRLETLKKGDVVEIDGPYGEFCLPNDYLSKKFIFICSGTGIAPFHSFISTYKNLNYLLVHGIRDGSEMYDRSDYDKDKYIACISKNSNGKSLRVTDYIRDHIYDADSIVYLCGNKNMIIDSVELLLERGFSGSQIISEVFF
jgi:NAD(P)H-flavin reductase